ncbi:MAG: NAD(P)-dependent dehydrogenase (short-subunit alcohol dehydrogenase family) [Alcanivorax sp.]|jgi:NAD(P)-dependent dehydrogenase (short-subunit alcohol dehydrogenase family)
MGRLAGKVALITGAASGIGYATARKMINEGAQVLATDINGARVIETALSLGDHAEGFEMDVSSEQAWENTTHYAVERFGKLDIVCNIAGIGFPGSIRDLEMSHWNTMIAVNLTGTMLGCKYGIAAIGDSGGSGAIINVSSIGGLAGISDIAGYCATKGGVTTLTKSVAMFCAEQRLPIRCVSIHPTYVDTEMLDDIADTIGSRQVMLDAMANEVPIGRVAKPEDVANTIAFAASDEAAMISGSALLVDGAQLAGPRPTHSSGEAI